MLQWLRRTRGGQRFSWVSLDETDADSTSFGANVTEALSAMDPGRSGERPGLIRRRRADRGGVLLPTLVNALDGVEERGVL